MTIIVATHGADRWADLARERAWPSAREQAPTVLRHFPDTSLAEARNELAREATTEWLCFLDADDKLAPGYVAAMARVARQQARRERLLVPALSFVYEDGTETQPEIPNGGGTVPLYAINCACIGTLISRHLFLRVRGFDPQWLHYEDWELWLRCVRDAGAELIPVRDAVYRAFVDQGSRHRADTASQETEYWEIRRIYEPDLSVTESTFRPPVSRRAAQVSRRMLMKARQLV